MLAGRGAGRLIGGGGRGGREGGHSLSVRHLQQLLSGKHDSPIIFLCVVQRTQFHVKRNCIDDFCITPALSQNAALYAPYMTVRSYVNNKTGSDPLVRSWYDAQGHSKCGSSIRAALYSTGLTVQLTRKGVVFSFLFFCGSGTATNQLARRSMWMRQLT